MQLLRQQFRRHHNRRWEERSKEEPQPSRKDRTGNEAGDEPEAELQSHAHNHVSGDREFFTDATGNEPEDYSAEGQTKPEAGDDHAGREGFAVAHAEHEGDEPAAEGDFDADVEEEKD